MAKVVTTPSLTTKRDYVSGFEYYTDFEEVFNRLEHFAMDEGRMRPTTPGGTTYRYEFDLKDHASTPLSTGLGNTRMTLTDANKNGVFDNYAAEVLQADDYYPFGMRITRKLSASDNKYTYNGKEHENEFGLKCLPRLVDWRWHRGYHYGARYYDPAIGRWWAVDPADQFISPYNYVSNTPTLLTDPDGRIAIIDDFIFGGIKGMLNGNGFWDGAMKDVSNSAKIWGGLFQGKASEIGPRLTTELIQTTAGFLGAHFANTFMGVSSV